LLVDSKQITEKLHKYIQYMEPFGPGNMKPMLAVKSVRDSGSREVGKDGSHLKIDIENIKDGKKLEGIAFGMAHYIMCVQQAVELEVGFHIDMNIWNNTRRLQLMVHGLRSAAESEYVPLEKT
jgi:single-stranded-DNA-specific exonuclease